jgi:phosphoglycerate dehydrogenase-like enzyme
MSPEAEERLCSFATLVKNESDEVRGQEEMQDLLATADGCLTGWGGITIGEPVIAAANRLKIIAHMGGSVRRLVPPLAYEKGIVITHAAPIIAESVAEMALLLTLASLRRTIEHDSAFKQHGTPGNPDLPYSTNHGLHGSRVGIIGASLTGRAFIRLLHAFGEDVEIWVYDPYLSDYEAGVLQVKKVDFEMLLAECDVVSLHAPSNEKTHHMIGGREARLMKGGAVLVNTARGPLVNYDEVLTELKAGRIRAGLDVYLETLTEDQMRASEYRQLPNVIVTPGRAGPSDWVKRQIGGAMVDELARFFTGLDPRYKVTEKRREKMA